jgi:hypothetical protein
MQTSVTTNTQNQRKRAPLADITSLAGNQTAYGYYTKKNSTSNAEQTKVFKPKCSEKPVPNSEMANDLSSYVMPAYAQLNKRGAKPNTRINQR